MPDRLLFAELAGQLRRVPRALRSGGAGQKHARDGERWRLVPVSLLVVVADVLWEKQVVCPGDRIAISQRCCTSHLAKVVLQGRGEVLPMAPVPANRDFKQQVPNSG